MFKLKHVAFAFVITHREILGSPGKALSKCILQHAWCHTWEVLVDGVAGNMSHFQSIFLYFPLLRPIQRTLTITICSSCYFRAIKYDLILSASCGNLTFNVSSITHHSTLLQRWAAFSEFLVIWSLRKWPERDWWGYHFGAQYRKWSKIMLYKRF